MPRPPVPAAPSVGSAAGVPAASSLRLGVVDLDLRRPHLVRWIGSTSASQTEGEPAVEVVALDLRHAQSAAEVAHAVRRRSEIGSAVLVSGVIDDLLDAALRHGAAGVVALPGDDVTAIAPLLSGAGAVLLVVDHATGDEPSMDTGTPVGPPAEPGGEPTRQAVALGEEVVITEALSTAGGGAGAPDPGARAAAASPSAERPGVGPGGRLPLLVVDPAVRHQLTPSARGSGSSVATRVATLTAGVHRGGRLLLTDEPRVARRAAVVLEAVLAARRDEEAP